MSSRIFVIGIRPGSFVIAVMEFVSFFLNITAADEVFVRRIA